MQLQQAVSMFRRCCAPTRDNRPRLGWYVPRPAGVRELRLRRRRAICATERKQPMPPAPRPEMQHEQSRHGQPPTLDHHVLGQPARGPSQLRSRHRRGDLHGHRARARRRSSLPPAAHRRAAPNTAPPLVAALGGLGALAAMGFFTGLTARFCRTSSASSRIWQPRPWCSRLWVLGGLPGGVRRSTSA